MDITEDQERIMREMVAVDEKPSPAMSAADADLRAKIDYIFGFCQTMQGAMEGIQQNPMARNMFSSMGLNLFRAQR